MTLEQDTVLAALKRDGMIPFNEIRSMTVLNALRDLCKMGKARFARFSRDNAGYVLVGHSFLDDLR